MELKPFLINFERKINNKKGHLICLEDYKLNFIFKRLFWITGFDKNSFSDVRGNHGHKNSDQILICLKGSCKLLVNNNDIFLMKTDDVGLFLPRNNIITMTEFSEDCLLLVLSNINFKDDEYFS